MTELAHFRTGAGAPLLLLHGIGDSWRTWTLVLDRLAERFEVIAVDLPGFGESPALPTDQAPTPRRLAEEVAAWLDEHALPDAHLVGSSLGGWVALELAALGRARSVVALSPGGFYSDRDRERARALLRVIRRLAVALVPPSTGQMSPRVERLLRPVVSRAVLFAAVVARPWSFPADMAPRTVRALANAPGWDATLNVLTSTRYAPPPDGLSVPVTIAWGARDRLLAATQRARARELLPKARVGLLPGCGHLPMWDDPDLVVRAVLTSTARARASG
jgi:pimeloyl-ACP methyl ester carboxylesterase